MNQHSRKHARLTSFLRKALKPLFAVCALAPVFAPHLAAAQTTYIWNQPAGGAWDTATANWTAPNTIWANGAGNNTASFGATAPTGGDTAVQVNATINLIGITFTAGNSTNFYDIQDNTGSLNLTGPATITVNPGVTGQISSVLNDATTTDTLLITGGGTLMLAGDNSTNYSGATLTIATGTTVITETPTLNPFGSALPESTAIVVNGTLNLNGANLSIAGSGLMHIASLAGSGIVTNGNATAYSNLIVGAASTASSSNFSGQLTDANAASGTITAAMIETPNNATPNGSLGLTLQPPAGAGYTLTLSGTSNNYTGLTAISNGGTTNTATLSAGAVNALSPNSVVDVGVGGILDLNGHSQIVAGLSTTASLPDTGTITNNAANTGNVAAGQAPVILTVGNTALPTGVANALISQVSIQNGNGVLGLTKIGGYTQVMSGDNNYSGATLVSAGVLTAGSATGFSANSTYTVNGTLDINGYNATVGALSGSGNVTNGIATDPDSGGVPATLTAGANATSTTFSGTLTNGASGALTLAKTGSGTLTLTNGTNGYTGGTNINAGTLSFVGGALSTGLVTFTGNSTLQYQPGNSQDTSLVNGIKIDNGFTATIDTNGNNVTYSTAFQGPSTGALTKTGLGTLSLAAVNVYSGGTNINQGTLNFANGAIGSGAVTFTGNSTLQWASGNTQDVSSTQSGPLTINPGVTATFDTNGNKLITFADSLTTGAGSAVTKTGLGTLQLGGTNTYNGATTVNNGTLQAGSTTAFSPNSAFSVLSPGVLDLNGNSNTIGSLAGSGTVTNNGTAGATLTEGGNNTSTTFSGVIQNGTAPLALVTTGTGALTLSGANTFTGGTTINGGSTIFVANANALGNGNVVNNGKLAVASSSSPTAVQIGGNYTQGAGAQLDLRIGGTTNGTYDRLAVVGSASVSGQLNVASINGFAPKNGEMIPIITAGGGVSGQFQPVTGSLANYPLVKLTVEYLANEVVLDFSQGSFMAPHIYLTPNEKAVAGALNHVSSNPASARLVSLLDSLPLQSLPGSYDLIAPTEYGAIYEISRSAAKMEAATIENRLDEVHAAAAPTGAGGPSGPMDYKGSKEVMPPPEDRLSVFANGSGEFVNVGDSSNAKGFNFGTGAATVGIDYRCCEHFLAGVLLNYSGSTVDVAGGERLNANSFRGGVYASAFGAGAYVNTYIGGASSDYDMNRPGFGGSVHGSTGGGDFNALIATGYDVHAGGFTYGPVASFQYTYTGLDSFNERGSLDPLHVNSGYGTSLLTNVGMRATYDWHIGGIVIVPEVRATWQHESGDVFDEVSATMLFGSPAFTVTTSPIGRDSLMLNAGFTIRITPTISAYAFYDGELARTNYQANNVMVGLRTSF